VFTDGISSAHCGFPWSGFTSQLFGYGTNYQAQKLHIGWYLFTVINSGLFFCTVCLQLTCWALVSSCDCELWPMFLTFELDLDRGYVNQHSKYLGEGHLVQSHCMDTLI